MPVPVGGTAPFGGQLTVNEIAIRVKRQFGDEVGSQITDADVMRWINDAQRDIALNNNLLQIKADTPVLANENQYGLPQNILTLHSVKMDGTKLRGLSPQEADELTESQNSTGVVSHFTAWANSLTLIPTPHATGNLTLLYTRQPIVVNELSDVPELPSQYHNRIVEYCIAQAYELDSDMASYQAKMEMFKQGVSEMKDNSEWTERDFYPSISVSAADTHYPYHDSYGIW